MFSREGSITGEKNHGLKTVSIIGATGSIGRQALEVIAAYPDRLRVCGLAAGSDVRSLAALARAYKPRMAAVAEEDCYEQLRAELSGTGIEVLAGSAGVAAVAAADEADITLAAAVGAAGIESTLAAVDAGKIVALANKETLVAAGALVTVRARERGARIIPVDSEHSAVFQCLAGVGPAGLSRIILTASGGPFLRRPMAELPRVTAAEALAHPNWRMGPKITIDSATMINKGLEVIEAHWLFGVDFDHIDVVIHPQSIVHSLIELVDGAVLAQLGLPDMRLPIAYALSYPERLPLPGKSLGTLAGTTLEFVPVEPDRYPGLVLAYEMGRRGSIYPAVLSAANEVAVAAFLQGKIGFTDIARIVAEVCGQHAGDGTAPLDLEAVLAADTWARARTSELIRE